MNIIVFEEDSDLRALICSLLLKQGYSIECLADWQIINSAGFVPPELFIIDMSFEALPAPALCRKLKENERTDFVPIIIMASKPKDIEECLQAGADDFIQKPFVGAEMVSCVNKWIKGCTN